MVGGALLVMLLVLTSEALFGLGQRKAVSAGLRGSRADHPPQPAPGFGL
jgi:hypothetical protein